MTGFTSPNYTQIPNDFFDMIATMSEAEVKVTLIAMRQIFGFHKTSPEAISLSQFQQRTGLSRNGVIKGIKESTERGILERSGTSKRSVSTYRIVVTSSKSELVDDSTSSKSEPVTSSKSEHTKEIVVKEKETAIQQPEVVSVEEPAQEKPIDSLPVTNDKMSGDDFKEFQKIINQDFKAYKGRDMNIMNLLMGRSKKKGYKEYAFTDKPVDLAELKSFVAWYRRTYPNISLPQAPDKIASRVEEFRHSVQKRNPVTPMVASPANPYNMPTETSAEELEAIQKLIEETKKKIRGAA